MFINYLSSFSLNLNPPISGQWQKSTRLGLLISCIACGILLVAAATYQIYSRFWVNRQATPKQATPETADSRQKTEEKPLPSLFPQAAPSQKLPTTPTLEMQTDKQESENETSESPDPFVRGIKKSQKILQDLRSRKDKQNTTDINANDGDYSDFTSVTPIKLSEHNEEEFLFPISIEEHSAVDNWLPS